MESSLSPLAVIVSLCIALNLLCFSIDSYPGTDSINTFIDYSNTATGWIYLIEMAVKLAALGGTYFESSYNRLDCLVVLTFIIEKSVTSAGSSITIFRCVLSPRRTSSQSKPSLLITPPPKNTSIRDWLACP